MPDLIDQVRQHYARDGIVDRILDALRAAGKDPERLTLADLAPLDQLHMRNIEATRDLAELAELQNGDRVLDVGCGLGGPARTFASEYGCEVVGVDLVPEFVQAGNALSERLGLQRHVRLREGNALELPFDDGSFDVVTSMAAFMNIEDKAGAYREIRRVLRPGGRLAQLEVFAGPGGPLHFPVLWARDAAYSFLVTPDEARRTIEGAGFETSEWVREDDATIEWGDETAKAMQQGAPPMGAHVLIGAEAPLRIGNTLRNVKEGRATAYMLVAEATLGAAQKGQVQPVEKRR